MDFSTVSDADLLELAESACGTYDGLRIYPSVHGALADLIPQAKHVWDAVRAEVEARGLGEMMGL